MIEVNPSVWVLGCVAPNKPRVWVLGFVLPPTRGCFDGVLWLWCGVDGCVCKCDCRLHSSFKRYHSGLCVMVVETIF